MWIEFNNKEMSFLHISLNYNRWRKESYTPKCVSYVWPFKILILIE